jgi:hypothetical protein
MRNNAALLMVTVLSKSEAKVPTPDAKPVGFKVQSVFPSFRTTTAV